MAAINKKTYFTTRDLLMMAAMAALGGVAGTYVNALGDVFQSILGFAGTTQWAAGLHVLWLVMAVGLTGKQGAGTFTGILKGAVELLSGNTHGLLVMLIDGVAGLLVDLGFLPFRDKRNRVAFMLVGGLASASNVFVFQLFAALPADMLAYGALALVGLVAFISGVVFAGVLGNALIRSLRRAGIVREQASAPLTKRGTWILYGALSLLTVAFGVYLVLTLKGPPTVQVGGAVAAPYAFPASPDDLVLVTRTATMNGVSKSFKGIPLAGIIAKAEPQHDQGLVLATASDGYAFFLSMAEINSNDALLLVPKGSGDDASYDMMGALNSKAWIRSVATLTLITAEPLVIDGALGQPGDYDPDVWQFDMDAFSIDLGNGAQKLQGAPLGRILESMDPDPQASAVVLHTQDGQTVDLLLSDVLGDDGIRIFTVIGESAITYAVANSSGHIHTAETTRIEVKQ